MILYKIYNWNISQICEILKYHFLRNRLEFFSLCPAIFVVWLPWNLHTWLFMPSVLCGEWWETLFPLCKAIFITQRWGCQKVLPSSLLTDFIRTPQAGNPCPSLWLSSHVHPLQSPVVLLHYQGGTWRCQRLCAQRCSRAECLTRNSTFLRPENLTLWHLAYTFECKDSLRIWSYIQKAFLSTHKLSWVDKMAILFQTRDLL